MRDCESTSLYKDCSFRPNPAAPCHARCVSRTWMASQPLSMGPFKVKTYMGSWGSVRDGCCKPLGPTARTYTSIVPYGSVWSSSTTYFVAFRGELLISLSSYKFSLKFSCSFFFQIRYLGADPSRRDRLCNGFYGFLCCRGQSVDGVWLVLMAVLQICW